MGAIGAITKALANPKIQKYLFIILVVIVLLVVLSSVSDKAKRIFMRARYGIQGDEPYAHITESRELVLEQMGTDLKTAIYSIWDTATNEIETINGVSDSEFAYIDEHYARFLSENTMYYDIDWEILPETEADDIALARLKRMNLA